MTSQIVCDVIVHKVMLSQTVCDTVVSCMLTPQLASFYVFNEYLVFQNYPMKILHNGCTACAEFHQIDSSEAGISYAFDNFLRFVPLL